MGEDRRAAPRLIVATIAGAIAFKQYLLASASAERQDRAYLLPDRVEIDIHPDTIPIVRVVIKNFGKTPASNFTVTSQCKVVRSPSSVFEKPTDPRVLLNVIIAPTGASTFFQDCGEKTTQDDIDNLRAHQVSIYFTAQLKYRDVFNRSHRSIIRRFVGGSAGLRDNAMANSANLGEGDEAD